MSTEQSALKALLAGASYEALPQWVTTQPSLGALLPAGAQVYLPYHANADFQDTVVAAAVLAAAGLRPVPHFPVRTIASRQQATERLAALAFAGADTLLLIAGDQDRPAGPFESTLDMLETGFLAEYGFYGLGVAGHPQGHRRIPDAELARALALKKDYATATGTQMWVVSQFLLSAESGFDWLYRMRDALDPLPIRIGLPGPTGLRTLLSYAARCGIGASAKFLARQAGVTRLLGGWSPEAMIHELVDGRLSADGALFTGLHFYPFGNVAYCAEWVADLGARSADTGLGAHPRPSTAADIHAYDQDQATATCWATTESDP